MSLYEAAEAVARDAMAGLVDKAGNPLIYHSLRVAALAKAAGETEAVQAVAVLHDIIEDTDATADDLRMVGIPEVVIEAVEVMTHTDHSPYRDYIGRVIEHPWAAKVKVYDIADNTTPDRLAYAKRPAKFGEALAQLAEAGYR